MGIKSGAAERVPGTSTMCSQLGRCVCARGEGRSLRAVVKRFHTHLCNCYPRGTDARHKLVEGDVLARWSFRPQQRQGDDDAANGNQVVWTHLSLVYFKPLRVTFTVLSTRDSSTTMSVSAKPETNQSWLVTEYELLDMFALQDNASLFVSFKHMQLDGHSSLGTHSRLLMLPLRRHVYGKGWQQKGKQQDRGRDIELWVPADEAGGEEIGPEVAAVAEDEEHGESVASTDVEPASSSSSSSTSTSDTSDTSSSTSSSDTSGSKYTRAKDLYCGILF